MNSNAPHLQQLACLLSLKPSETKLLYKANLSARESIFADADYLKYIHHFNDNTINKLHSLRKIIDIVGLESCKEQTSLASPKQVIAYCKLTMSSLSREVMRVFFVNSQNALIDSTKKHGCVNSVYIYVRNIIKRALILEATGIILVHNHPSGSDVPSINDISTTKELITATTPLDIHVLDHVIITRNSHFSMRENGLI